MHRPSNNSTIPLFSQRENRATFCIDDSTPQTRQSDKYSLAAQKSLTPRLPSATIPFSFATVLRRPPGRDTLDTTRLYQITSSLPQKSACVNLFFAKSLAISPKFDRSAALHRTVLSHVIT